MLTNIRTLSIGLACGGLAMLTACEPVVPPSTDAQFGTVAVEYSYEEGVELSEGLTGLYLDYYFGMGGYPNAKVKLNVQVDNFTVGPTTAASDDTAPGVLDGDEAAASYNPGCTDTYWSRETIAGGGILFYYYEPEWSPYDCPGPETIDDGTAPSWEDWNSRGHIQVFFNGIYVGAGYSNEFELEILRQPLFYTPDFGYGIIDRNGVIQPWVDLNGDYEVDYGQDWDLDGVIRGAEAIEPDVDGDGAFDENEPDRDGDGNLDLYFEDQDGDGLLDVNEDTNGDGIGDLGEDLDCDGNLDVYEPDENGCWDPEVDDVDGDGFMDTFDEDVNGNGQLDPGEDIDINGDCRIDIPVDPETGEIIDSEDLDGDGNLDVNEDVDGDGVRSTSEDVDGDAVWDVFDETELPLQCEGKEFGCEGDDVLLITSGDYLMVIPLLFFGWDGFYTYDSTFFDVCDQEENLMAYITLKLVHDDHSDIYGAPQYTIPVTKDDMEAMGLITCVPQDGWPNDEYCFTPYGYLM